MGWRAPRAVVFWVWRAQYGGICGARAPPTQRGSEHMSTDPRQERTLGQLVASATQDLSTLVRSEIALAKVEVSVQLKKAGVGGGLFAGAAVLAFYSVYFIFTTIAEGLQALGVARWLS